MCVGIYFSHSVYVSSVRQSYFFESVVPWLWYSLVILHNFLICNFSIWIFFLKIWKERSGVVLYFLHVYLIKVLTEELYVWYPFSYMYVVFLHGCVLLLIEEMDVWYLSTLFVWSLVVLAKNLPKGKIVGYLYVGLIIAKTNIYARCWIRFLNMFGTFQCALIMCHALCELYLFKESTLIYLMAKTRVFFLESAVCLFPKVVTIF